MYIIQYVKIMDINIAYFANIFSNCRKFILKCSKVNFIKLSTSLAFQTSYF